MATADYKSSALAEHVWTNEHPVDWNVKILTVSNDYNIRVVREAFAIRTAGGAMNRDGAALPHEYENLIAKPTVPSILYYNVAPVYIYIYIVMYPARMPLYYAMHIFTCTTRMLIILQYMLTPIPDVIRTIIMPHPFSVL